MRYCDECATKRKWPITLFKCQALCESCFSDKMCNESPTSLLYTGVNYERKQPPAFDLSSIYGENTTRQRKGKKQLGNQTKS